MVTDLFFFCEIEFAYYTWCWAQKGLDAETDCHLQRKLILDSVFKGLCHLQEIRFLVTESYIPTNALLYTVICYTKMLILKHLKTLQHVSIIIQIIFRELVGSLLK